jgi:hypothetical protein
MSLNADRPLQDGKPLRYPAQQNDGLWMVVEVTGWRQPNGLIPGVLVEKDLPSREIALAYCEKPDQAS